MAERIPVARLQMNIHPDMLQAYQDKCYKERVKMTDQILSFVADQLRADGIEVNPVWLMAPKNWTK